MNLSIPNLIVIPCLVFLLSAGLYSQSPVHDSPEREFLALQLMEIEYYKRWQLDTAVIYFEQAERQVLQMNDQRQAAEAFYELSTTPKP